MKETIYTIPVTEAFESECECPLCVLETKLENEYVEYVLGASLMEPDSRKLTNEKGFCRKHFEMLYKKQENKLGLGLIIDTHLTEQNEKFSRITGISPNYTDTNKPIGADDEKTRTMSLKGAINSLLFNREKTENRNDKKDKSSDASVTGSVIDKIIAFIDDYEEKCYICDKLDYTMNRYIEVIYHLYFVEKDFKRLFDSQKGFCFPHLKSMLQYAKKLDSKKREQIVGMILRIQADNMERIQKEVNWFTKKFDYRYDSEPWGNSRDAIPRSIKKMMGPCRFK